MHVHGSLDVACMSFDAISPDGQIDVARMSSTPFSPVTNFGKWINKVKTIVSVNNY